MLCCSNEACAISVSRESLSRRLQDLQQQIKRALELLKDRKAGKAQLSALRSAANELRIGRHSSSHEMALLLMHLGFSGMQPGVPGDLSFRFFIPLIRVLI